MTPRVGYEPTGPELPRRFSTGGVLIGLPVEMLLGSGLVRWFGIGTAVSLAIGVGFLLAGLALALPPGSAARRGAGLGVLMGWGLMVSVAGLLAMASATVTGLAGACSSMYPGAPPAQSSTPTPPPQSAGVATPPAGTP
jgi:hypothetical protein